MNVVFQILIAILFISLLVYVLIGVSRVFRKAGEKAWYCIIPVYSSVVLARIAGKPWWWGVLASIGYYGRNDTNMPHAANAFLAFVALVAFAFNVLIGLAVAKKFHRSTLFGVLLLGFLPFIGYPILGYGSATYDKAATT